MYQEILPHHFDNHYFSAEPKDNDIVLSYDGANVLMKDAENFFRYHEVSHEREFTYLFSVDQTQYWLSDLMDTRPVSLSIHTLRRLKPKETAFAAITGWQLYTWYRDNRYCGRCGSLMDHDRKERAMHCAHCGNLVYPRINPVVIAAIKNDRDELLVTKYAHGNYARYALVAGFMEIGETAEEAVVREAKEETGLDVTDIEYYKDQPWAFSSSLIFGFVAHARGDQKIVLDESELKEAVWITRDRKEVNPDDGSSITGEMIRKYLEGEL